MRTASLGVAGAAGLLLAAVGALPGQEAEATEDIYANTPLELVPYGDFQDPYRTFFRERIDYWGPGREKASPAAGDSAVKIGFLGPLSGSREVRLGKQMLRGARLAVEEANRAGGFRGRPFTLLARNDAGVWGASSNELVELEKRGVWATMGSIDGANTHIMLRIALKMGMPLVVSGDTDPTFTETRIPWAIRVIGDDRQACYALVLQIREVRGFTRVAVLRDNDRYGRVGTEECKDALKRLGSPVSVELRYSEGDTTFRRQLERIRRTDPDALLVWGDAPEAGRIVRQMETMGMDQPVFGPSRLVSDRFLEIAGPAAEGVVAAYPYDPTREDSLLRDFRRRYRNRFGEDPGYFAAHAYDGMKILVGAIRRAGLNRVRIRDELAGVRRYRGVTGRIVLDERWDDVGPIYLAEVRGGEFRFFSSPLEVRSDDYGER